jgi:hypothetical protein
MDPEHFDDRQSRDAPFEAFGVRWTNWRTGDGSRTDWRSEDQRLVAQHASEGRTFRALVDGEPLQSPSGLPRRFLSLTSAMEAAVEAVNLTNPKT